MQKRREYSSGKIKQQEAQVADGYFYVVSKNAQKEHVSYKVHPAAMQEHAGNQCVKLVGLPYSGWHCTIRIKKALQFFGTKLQLLPENVAVYNYKYIRKYWLISAFDIIVAYREEHTL
jgi:hypothetical protein